MDPLSPNGTKICCTPMIGAAKDQLLSGSQTNLWDL